MTTLYLVRHAHADWTPDENRPLSAQGGQDARRVADILHAYPIRAIYSSPASRALQTISPLGERLGLAIVVEEDLRERKLGEGAFEDFLHAVEITWKHPSFAHPGGESSEAAKQRGMLLVQRILERHPAEHVVISTHGNLMALILQGFDPEIDFAFWNSLTMPDVYKVATGQSGNGLLERLWPGTFGPKEDQASLVKK